MRLDDGAVKAPLLLFFSFRTEVIQSDCLALSRVAGDHVKSVGKRWGNSHAHAACSGHEVGTAVMSMSALMAKASGRQDTQREQRKIGGKSSSYWSLPL
jgi:hypothetical protein